MIMDLIQNPVTPIVISILSIIISIFVASKQYHLGKRSVVQGEYQQKERIMLSVIDLITAGSKYDFNDETLEKFWKNTVSGRHLFGNDLAKFIEGCGNRYKIALDDIKKDPNKDSMTVESAGHWFWHQRDIAHDKFDRYFSG